MTIRGRNLPESNSFPDIPMKMPSFCGVGPIMVGLGGGGVKSAADPSRSRGADFLGVDMTTLGARFLDGV